MDNTGARIVAVEATIERIRERLGDYDTALAEILRNRRQAVLDLWDARRELERLTDA
jgi:hypothetical protein